MSHSAVAFEAVGPGWPLPAFVDRERDRSRSLIVWAPWIERTPARGAETRSLIRSNLVRVGGRVLKGTDSHEDDDV